MQTAHDLEAAINELDTDNPIGEAMADLARQGLIIPTSERRNGQIVWVAATAKN